MIKVRDRLAMALAGASAAYAAVTAYWIRADFPSTDSPESWVLTGLVGVHAIAVLAWCTRPHLRRFFVALAGVIEIAVGIGLFWTAPILHGRFAPPGQPLISPLQIFGLAGLAGAGLLLIVAAVIHTRHYEEVVQ